MPHRSPRSAASASLVVVCIHSRQPHTHHTTITQTAMREASGSGDDQRFWVKPQGLEGGGTSWSRTGVTVSAHHISYAVPPPTQRGRRRRNQKKARPKTKCTASGRRHLRQSGWRYLFCESILIRFHACSIFLCKFDWNSLLYCLHVGRWPYVSALQLLRASVFLSAITVQPMSLRPMGL